MGRKKKEDNKDEVVVLEKIEKTKSSSGVSEVFYYLLGLVIGIVLIFATEELLSTINYLFVVIFAIIAVVQLIGFIMDKKYISRDYSNLIIGIMCIWVAMFVFKYGSFLFLEMLPVLVSLLLFIMATSSITKYFDRKITGNLIVSIISIILLIFVPKSVMYTLFKVVGVYIIVMIILDFIDYRKNNKSA